MLKAEYVDNFRFGESFEALSSHYSQVRRLRRDGNCFYRAYLFQMFEHFIVSTGTLSSPKVCPEYEAFVKSVEGSKKDLMDQGYDEIAIEDFH